MNIKALFKGQFRSVQDLSAATVFERINPNDIYVSTSQICTLFNDQLNTDFVFEKTVFFHLKAS